VQEHGKRSRVPAGLTFALLVCASTAWGEPIRDDTAPQTIEGLKDSVVERLVQCETKGQPDANNVVVIDTNNKASIGKLQFQAETVVNYTKLIEGRAIDKKEAIQIALDGGRAAMLAKRIIFEKDGLGNWHLCSRELRLAPEVKLIQSLMK
jgi:hypothetical protein